jgi:putative methionine-R-sulfoxide reductase with GAF domain
MENIKRFFAAPVFEDEDKTRNAFYLNAVSLSAAGLLTLYVIYRNLTKAAFGLSIIDYVLLGFIVVFLAVRYIMTKGYVNPASHIVVGLIWLGLAFLAQDSDGIRDVTFFGLFVVILMASLLLGTRAMLIYSALSILAGFGLVYLQNTGAIEVKLDQPQNFARDISFIFILFATFLYLVTSSLSNALKSARSNAQELQKNNEELLALQNDLEQRVAARTRDLEIVAEVGTVTATILESKRLLQEVVDLTKERFNLYHSHIYLLDEEARLLVLTAGAGEAGRVMVTEGRSIPLDREQSLVARAARERKGVTVNDVTQNPDFLPNPLLPDTRSELAVPMIVGGNVIGVFDIQSEQIGRFTDSDVNIQTTLAAQLATSIQNVRSFEQSKRQAELQSLVNVIGSRIQRTTSIEETLQTAIRELGTAIGASRVQAKIQPASKAGSTEPTSAD